MWVLRRVWLGMLVVCVTTAAQTGKRPAPSQPRAVPPNIIVITLDTTRADRMGFLGSDRGLTPNLDGLAKDSVVFPRAYSNVPLTPPSHATIFSGTYPQYHHVIDFGSRLGTDVPYLPAILQKKGYRTAAFVGSLILDPVEGTGLGFDRGFDDYDAGFHMRRPGEDRYKSIERRGEEVVEHAEAWMAKHPRGPFFMWLHFYDAHDPYDPPEPFKTKYANAPYDGEIAYVDSVVGKFLGQLRAKGLYEKSIIAVMADHGEALGEHGEDSHGVFLYDETIHVPLLFKLPGDREAGKRIENRATLVDVTPTILTTAGMTVPKEMQGKSLLAEMTASGGQKFPDSPAYAETDYPHTAFGWATLQAWREGKYLFVQAPQRELYDQTTDPGALHNLAPSSKAVSDTLAGQTTAFREKTARAESAEEGTMDASAQEKLNALGYVASTPGIKVGPGVTETDADPKDKVEIVNTLHKAILDVDDGRYEVAIPLLEDVLKQESGIPVAYMELGSAYTFLKQYEKAIPPLQKAVSLLPGMVMPQYQLGLSLSATGDWVGAVPHFEEAAAKSPKWAELHFSLAAAYARVNRPEDARKELETTVKLEPDNFRANMVLGRMLTLQGKPAEGLANLKKAVKLEPKSPDAHMFLAEAYGRTGQLALAKREAAEAERLKGQ